MAEESAPSRARLVEVYRCSYETPLRHVAVAGRCIVSAGEDNALRIHDLEGGQVLKTIERVNRYISRLAPFDAVRVIVGLTTRYGVLDIRSGRLADLGPSTAGFSPFGKALPPSRVTHPEAPCPEPFLPGRSYEVVAEAQLDDDRILYLVGEHVEWDHQFFQVWNFRTGQELLRFAAADSEGRSLWAIDARTAISSHDDQMFRIWDVEDGRERRAIRHDCGFVRPIMVIDGRWLLFAPGEPQRCGAMQLWSLETGAELARLLGRRAFTTIIGADDRRFCALDADGWLALLKVEV